MARKQKGGPQAFLERVKKQKQDRKTGPRPKKSFKNDRRKQSTPRRADDRDPVTELTATVEKHRKGFAFLVFDSPEHEDGYVDARMAQNLFPGDRVVAHIDVDGDVVRVRVLEHTMKVIFGKYTFLSPKPKGKEWADPKARARRKSGKESGWVVYEKRNTREEVLVPSPPRDLKPGNWVQAKLVFNDSKVTAEIVKNYGEELPPSADIDVVSNEYNLVEHHSAEAKKEAGSFTLQIPGKDLEGRKDLRDLPFITIDGETARDFDDAIFVEKKKYGYLLWVAIADVSHYVKEGSKVDEEAYVRATSVYFPERAFHMLPRELSENLCSLRPKEPRLAMVAQMKFNDSGKRTETKVFEAVIESKRRATYTEIQKEWEEEKENKSWKFRPHFELFQRLRKKRLDRGSIDFDLPEAYVLVDEEAVPTEIEVRDRIDTHRLIEEFMIAANEAVTEWMIDKGWPFIYRIHEEPKPEAILNFKRLAATVGLTFSTPKGEVTPKAVAQIVDQLEGHTAQALLNTALLRSLKQAIYSADHGIHFGLASEAYTHFTSPIRRYPDLIVHRLLRLAVQYGNKEPPADLAKKLPTAAQHCSTRERIAADAERQSIRLKQVRLMKERLGDEFEATISGMNERGIFVQVFSPYVEGMIAVDYLGDDHFQFNEERMVMVGRRSRRTFQMGQSLNVKCVRADLERRQIDFVLNDQPAR